MKKGNTLFFETKPRIRSYAAICGSKEKEGVIGSYADITLSDDMYGESTYEKAECKMLSNAVRLAVEKAALTDADIDVLLSGDLLNQIISASFAARAFQFPFLGLYSACSTMSEGMLLAAALVDGGFAKNCVAATGSHFASAERQYRYPLELGCTRPPQAQWTVTGCLRNVPSLKGKMRTQFTLGAIIAGVTRFVSHYFSGVFAFGIFGATYADEFGIPALANPYFYSLVYQTMYIIPEMIIVIVVGVIALSSANLRREILRYGEFEKKATSVPAEAIPAA